MVQLAGDTEIANLALALLGSSSRLNSIGQSGAIAAAARDSLTIRVDALLQEHPWNFAMTRAEISATSATAATGQYAWAFRLPADCLQWWPWRNDDAHCFAAEQEGDLLLSNDEGPVVVRYTRRITDRTLWSPLFANAMVAQLAMDLAEAVAASQAKFDRAAAMLDDAMLKARRADGLATGRNDRPDARYQSRAVAAMGYGGYRDPARFHSE